MEDWAEIRRLHRAEGVASKVIHMSLEAFERGLVRPPTGDVSITVDGRRLDRQQGRRARLVAEVAAEVEAEEAARHATPGA